MTDKSHRKELQAEYKQSRTEAGVYRIVNLRNGRVLFGSTTNLASIRNKLEWSKSTNTPSALDHRLSKDIREFGIDAFSLEILEVLQPKPETTSAKLREELATLETLYRDEQDPSLLY